MTQLSIVILTRNEAENIGVLLEDLRRSALGQAEIVLVDGNSEDDTVPVARPYVDQVLLSRPGRARQLRAGSEVANGDWIWFLHADTRVSSAVADDLLSAIASPAVSWGRFDVSIFGHHPLLRVIAWFMNKRSCWTGIATGDQGIFVRKSLLEMVGGTPNLALMEDIELSRRLKTQAKPSCLKSELVTSGRRWESRGVWRTMALMWLLRFAWFMGVSDTTLARWYRQGRVS